LSGFKRVLKSDSATGVSVSGDRSKRMVATKMYSPTLHSKNSAATTATCVAAATVAAAAAVPANIDMHRYDTLVIALLWVAYLYNLLNNTMVWYNGETAAAAVAQMITAWG
jgi:hypothetical protein